MRFIKFYRVIQVDDGKSHLCLRDKVNSFILIIKISENCFFVFQRKLKHVMKYAESVMIFIDVLINIPLLKELN